MQDWTVFCKVGTPAVLKSHCHLEKLGETYLDWMTIEVFSNLKDSVTHMVIARTSGCPHSRELNCAGIRYIERLIKRAEPRKPMFQSGDRNDIVCLVLVMGLELLSVWV